MNIEVWITFSAATIALLAVPGPVVMLLLGYTMSSGRSVAAAAIPGVVLGDLVAMTISLLGAGAILQASATLFLALKIAGATYLVWLGVKIWKHDAKSTAMKHVVSARRRTRVTRDAFLVTALNPKDIVFFIAFLPQFIDPTRPVLSQIVILEVTFGVLVLCSTITWVLLAERVIGQLRHPKATKVISRFGASWLILAGVTTAASA
ncbi:MAG: LysE family translocator [Pseudomonadota bacterium]